MAYNIGLDMGITERAILSAIHDLQSKREFFTYCDIAEAVPCSEVTIWRFMPKLIKAKKVERIGAKHSKAVRYEIAGDKEHA